MTEPIVMWTDEAICRRGDALEIPDLAAWAYKQTCRTDFSAPGFCLLQFGTDIDSRSLRGYMVQIKRVMAELYAEHTGRTLVYLSAGRFDQQESTRPHRDGGPEECFLMLGYEPSPVLSRIEISDSSRCAFDLGLTPADFLERYNPMFREGYERLRPYTTRLACFTPEIPQILLINNSCARFSRTEPAWQGTLHTATILAPDESRRRIINSTMIASAPAGTPDAISTTEQDEFRNSSIVRRRGYDKRHLQDDR